MPRPRKSTPAAKPHATNEPPTEAPADLGLRCPDCNCADLRVAYVQHLPRGTTRRVRHCRHCHRRITTIERPTSA